MLSAVIFWSALTLIAYTYVGFPLLLLVRSWLRPRHVRSGEVTPRVSLLIVGYNEAEVIDAKLRNALALDYPKDRLQVIFASDGSDDGTNEIARRFREHGLLLLELPRGGKATALNTAASVATGEILVFSDANSIYAPGALRELIAPFADPSVGGVGGNQVYRADGVGGNASVGERLYWRYDRLLKTLQSRAGNLTSATGAIHALRRELFRPVPPGVSDDLMISTCAILGGKRLAFAPNAVAFESVAETDRAEFNRKLRVLTRAIRAMVERRELLHPWRFGFYSIQLFSHKVLRWSVCWMLLAVLGSSLMLYSAGGIYRALVHLQVAFYGTAALTPLLRRTPVARSPGARLIGIPFFFCMANYAALLAWKRVLAGERVEVWNTRGGEEMMPEPSVSMAPRPPSPFKPTSLDSSRQGIGD